MIICVIVYVAAVSFPRARKAREGKGRGKVHRVQHRPCGYPVPRVGRFNLPTIPLPQVTQSIQGHNYKTTTLSLLQNHPFILFQFCFSITHHNKVGNAVTISFVSRLKTTVTAQHSLCDFPCRPTCVRNPF